MNIPEFFGMKSRITLLAAIFCLLIALAVIIFMYRKNMIEQKNKNEYELPTDSDKLKIEVFNGCRDMRVTLEVVELLRKSGKVDVIDITKNPSYIYPYSVLLDRKGNKELMKNLGKYLGLSENRLILQRSNQFLDATLVVGIDSENLLLTLKERLKND